MTSSDGGPGYVAAYPQISTRERGKVKIAEILPPSNQINRAGKRSRAGTPADLIFSVILSQFLSCLALHLAKEWLLSEGGHLPVAAVNLRLLAIGSAILTMWFRPWVAGLSAIKIPSTALYGTLMCAETVAFLLAVDNLPVVRVVTLVQCSEMWMYGLIAMQKKSGSMARNAAFIALAAIGAAYTAERYLNHLIPKSAVNNGYLAVAAYLIARATRKDITLSRSNDFSTSVAEPVIGMLASLPPAFVLTFFLPSTMPSKGLPDSIVLPSLGLLALSHFFVLPMVSESATSRIATIKAFKWEWPVAVTTAAFIASTAFERMLHVTDFTIAMIAYFAYSHILHADPRLAADAFGSTAVVHTTLHKRSDSALQGIEKQIRDIRATIKVILQNPDSRKIYYFLCLNLAFMFVQMMYGIWTNSLGLISDSIHMFFDCLALAMGLLASVMATWPRNETFTYGYSRVETLSGFANGIFLILISIFIVFEAIQRLIDPPEMNTDQLLLVSFAGLCINLVGMFATGHHHHGHSHDHGHDHGHNHGHSHGHDHGNHHGHSHNMHGVFLHVMADTLGSVGVIISTLLINRYEWTGFDPIASIFIAVLIFASVVPLVTESGRLLCLDVGDSREKGIRGALAKLSSIEGLSSYAAARFWPKDTGSMIGSIHIQLAPAPSHDLHRMPNGGTGNEHRVHYANLEKVVQRVEKMLKGSIDGLTELEIQVEPTDGSDACPCMVVS